MTASYLDMQNAISRELSNRTDLSTEIKAAIQSAISHYQKHKFWFSEETDTATTTNLQSSIAVPTNFGWIDGLTIIYSSSIFPIRMIRRDWETMLDLMVNTTALVGQPTDYAIYNNQIFFWPTPNGAYTLTLYQNMQNAPPSADSDTSNWTDVAVAEELIRSRATADVRINVLKHQSALTELAALGSEPYFSKREMVAHKNLEMHSILRTSSGKVRGRDF